MSLCSARTCILKSLALLLIMAAVCMLVPSSAQAQTAGKKLTKQDVIDLLTGDVSSEDVAKQAEKSGIAFQMTPAVEHEIRGAGGTDALINALKSLSPAAPAAPRNNPAPSSSAPPVLMIEASPGQSEVYVDDEPIGSTSREGRLKLTRLTAGSHRVRISLSGYQDHEETVTLTGGAVTTVATSLQKAAVPQISPPSQPPSLPAPVEPPPAAPSGQPGYLGILPMEQQPAGARGVVISGAAPGGPGSQIGLKTYDVILAVNGQAVATPDALRAALSSHRAGETVNITWFNGSTNVTKATRLSAYPPTQTAVESSKPPTLSAMPHHGFVSFYVAHDHQASATNYCAGVMSIGNGMIYYKGTRGPGLIHTFEIPLNSVKEARRNGFYLANLGAFHIKLINGTNYNFVVLNPQNQKQYMAPDEILKAIDHAMGK
jgi:PEGA domain/PDZ domain